MAAKSSSDVYQDEKPTVVAQPNGKPKGSKKKNKLDYTSEGVRDNNIFALPSSDWQLLSVITGMSLWSNPP
jgi:hypothetical protein